VTKLDSLNFVNQIVGQKMALDVLMKHLEIKENGKERHTAEYDVKISLHSFFSLIRKHCLTNTPESVFLNWIISSTVDRKIIKSGPLVEKVYDIDLLKKMNGILANSQFEKWKIPSQLNKKLARKYADKYPGLFFDKPFKEETFRKLTAKEKKKLITFVVSLYNNQKKEGKEEEEMELYVSSSISESNEEEIVEEIGEEEDYNDEEEELVENLTNFVIEHNNKNL
jgi:hypothetical protein